MSANTKKNKRLHIPIKDINMQNRIKKVMEVEGLTYEQLCQKYFKLPDDEFETINTHFIKAKKILYSKLHDKNLSMFIDLVWVIIIKTAKNEFDIKAFHEKMVEEFTKYKK